MKLLVAQNTDQKSHLLYSRQLKGFTLVELMITAAASLIIGGVALTGLVQMQQASRRLDARLRQEAELGRALQVIAADIQEGTVIDANAASLAGYRSLFRIKRPGRPDIGYYLISATNRVWHGPYILYRRDFSEDMTYALIDRITDVAPSQCPSLGGASLQEEGVQVNLSSATEATRAVICLAAVGPTPTSEPVEQNIQAATRARP